MKIVNLYRYENADHSVTITPNKRNESDKESYYRLIADEGKVLTDGIDKVECIDTDNVEKWVEIQDENPEEVESE